MLTKLFFAALLGVSLSCFAAPEGGFKAAADTAQKNQSMAETKQQSRLKSLLPETQQDSTAPQQASDDNQKPSMIDYCRKHTC
ncbi:hypothetical protein SAMN05421690_104519 [Nitrosomonas sp. Nm51]|uniref:hypothetical protein n=1 Tax=Nitrosomonas sp. Nm51 TaxID=133720 RepID=UPI0008CD7A1E|nr:hypothetical protein [Nitrosomonas sp. Nm51]SER62349.1 hypothetical protein SAMN05421690_104519 [Nitrosomonas sp. Nm51]